ncbi:hypothetical protein Bb109J_c3099 [Bdellovibrio bacteriovorus]|uniref:hypothetical protein n=1 Tax=Bdellovibrio bacteriovorus TaxID=959 RepID=UPI001D04F298|nr:hypothetical protein [Bdellovibrio bacteriovorus]BEV69679.1 hypothetical protein Bb109J_c3099 [Bdellovibrio bacteriovorus]
MKRVFSRITAAILVASTLSACAPQSESADQSGNVRVLAPQSNSKAGYSLQTVELLGIEDLQTVTGKFVRFFLSPRITNNTLHGRPAVARFIKNKQGDFIPANEMTQQLVTIYAHTQKLALLDEELGAGGVNQWPRDVGVGVRVKGSSGANNAFYDGTTDSMLVVPYTQSGLAIAINAGILAHEHFHSLFFKLVLKDVVDEDTGVHSRESFMEDAAIVQEDLSGRGRREKPVLIGDELDEATLLKFHRLTMMRGLNEGLADFWGWMYTGNPDFIAQSLPSQKRVRSLEVNDLFGVQELPNKTVVRNNLELFHASGERAKFRDYVTGYAYTVGTQFSRMLKKFTDIYSKERGLEDLAARKEVAKIILKMLPSLKSDLAEKKDTYYTHDQFVQSLVKELGAMKKKECEFLAGVLETSAETPMVYSCVEEAGWVIKAETAANPESQEVK